jgi:hypothetical protein
VGELVKGVVIPHMTGAETHSLKTAAEEVEEAAGVEVEEGQKQHH